MKSINKMRSDLDRTLGCVRKLLGALTVTFEDAHALHKLLRSDIEEIKRLRRDGVLDKPSDPQSTRKTT